MVGKFVSFHIHKKLKIILQLFYLNQYMYEFNEQY